MIESSNSPEAVKIRKFQEVLKLCGNGIIVFIIWNIMKFILQIITEGNILFPDFFNAATEVKIVIIILICVFLLIDALLRFFVWRLSIKEANSLKKENLHIVFSVIIIVLKMVLLITSWFSGVNENILSYIVESILDLMDTALLVAIVVLTFRLRKLVYERKKVN